MTTGLKEWQHAGRTLRIESWYPRSERVICPAWHQGFVDGVLMVEGHDIEKVRMRLEEESSHNTLIVRVGPNVGEPT